MNKIVGNPNVKDPSKYARFLENQQRQIHTEEDSGFQVVPGSWQDYFLVGFGLAANAAFVNYLSGIALLETQDYTS